MPEVVCNIFQNFCHPLDREALPQKGEKKVRESVFFHLVFVPAIYLIKEFTIMTTKNLHSLGQMTNSPSFPLLSFCNLASQTFAMLRQTVPMLKNVGVIGVGKMGEAIAKNLVAAGHEVSMFDVNTSNVEEIADTDPSNLKALGSVREVAERCSIVVTMLPNDAILKHVCVSEGLIDEMAKVRFDVDWDEYLYSTQRCPILPPSPPPP